MPMTVELYDAVCVAALDSLAIAPPRDTTFEEDIKTWEHAAP
jgi:hypothetical protein